MARTNNKLNARLESKMANIGGSERSYRRCAITALHIHCFIEMLKKLLPVITNLHLMLCLFDFMGGCSYRDKFEIFCDLIIKVIVRSKNFKVNTINLSARVLTVF